MLQEEQYTTQLLDATNLQWNILQNPYPNQFEPGVSTISACLHRPSRETWDRQLLAWTKNFDSTHRARGLNRISQERFPIAQLEVQRVASQSRSTS